MCLAALGTGLAAVGSAVASIPAPVLLGTQVIAGAATTAAGYVAQQQQFDAQSRYIDQNVRAAHNARMTDLSLLESRQAQEAKSAAGQMFQSRVEGLQARGRALAQSGNVQGLSVTQLLNDFYAQEGRYSEAIRGNADLRITQLQRERESVNARAAQRVAGLGVATPPNPFATALGFAGSTLGTLTSYAINNPATRPGVKL